MIPRGEPLCLLARQTGHAEAVLDRVQGDLDLVADRDFELAIRADELNSGDHALGLEPGIDHNVVGGDLDHGSDNDGARLELGGAQTLFK